MEKAFFPVLLVLILLASCSSQNEVLSPNTKIHKNSIIKADYKIPQNLAELESDSEDIVQVKLIRNKEISKGNNGTITEVEIIKNYKGSFELGEKIAISEPWLLTSGEYQAVENYIAPEKGQEYILFLNGGHDTDKVSSITSLGYGKYNKTLLEQKNDMNHFHTVGEVQKYDFISDLEEDIIKYQEVKNEVLKKYN
ncbi:hypothetical protein JI641_03205 [Listeria ivanovii subsp. londoniensis]|uniref:hypothetical protein n=1 Tax=Listeria ivanovii TaxID=1638 RepID=UPI001905FC6E|nr:hypothetical protein [Listeria ivanovii]MBK2002022.1 hypothetical protein [Listeria ivanovii subsp. londoniensis]